MRTRFMENGLHVGKLIERVLEAKGISKQEFARRMGHGQSWPGQLLKKQSISTGLLFELSEALEYNFFETLAYHFNANFPGSAPQFPILIHAQLTPAKGVSLSQAVEYLETHFANHEKSSTNPCLLTRFSVEFGVLGWAGHSH